MNRENLKIKYFEALRYNRIIEKIGEYKDYSTESLEKEIKALISDAKEEQAKRKANNLVYIVLFFLNTSLYTKSYKYMLIVADESLYINKPLAIRYWVPDFINEDASLIRKELVQNRAKIPDLSEAEIEEGIRFVLKGYEDIISILWKKALESVIDTDIFKDTSKELLFLFGEYMGELKQVNLNMH